MINYRWKICICLLIVLLLTGCATTVATYNLDRTEKPQMSFSEAIASFHSLNKTIQTKDGPSTGRIFGNGVIVIGRMFFPYSGDVKDGGWTFTFRDTKELEIMEVNNHICLTTNNQFVNVIFDTQQDAMHFVDTFMALKYYLSPMFPADDAAAFADFREKAKAWRALPVKPAMPDDGQQFNSIIDAAEYYEHRLAVQPLWPQGQYNAAINQGKWGWYGVAAVHMKRYLELVPDAKNAEFARKLMYLYENMAKANKQELARLAQQLSAEIKRQREAEFREKAAAWRALQVKPALPESVQRLRVAAEDAFKNKDFKKAAEYYNKGLAVEPMWPQGLYNAALLEGELQMYGPAATHIRNYLELVPDAKNAEAAREKMYLWEQKATEAASQELEQKAPETSSPAATKKARKK